MQESLYDISTCFFQYYLKFSVIMVNRVSKCSNFYKLLASIVIVLFSIQPLDAKTFENDFGIMLPNVKQRVIKAGSTLNVTCIFIRSQKEHRNLVEWTMPNPEYIDTDEFKAQKQNDTHIFSTITLPEATPQDTGIYQCYHLIYPERPFDQYIYVYSENEPVIFNSAVRKFSFQHGTSGVIPCKPTHPNVSMSLKRINSFNIFDIPEEKLEENLLTSLGSQWKLEPKTGLRNQNVVLEDYGSYECQSLNQTKRTHFRIVVSGVELIREGNQDPYVRKGENITLLCRAYLFPFPPKWKYFNSQSGLMEAIDETEPPEGIRIVTENVIMPEEKLPIFLSRLFLNNSIINSTEFSCKASSNEEDESEAHLSLQVFDYNVSKSVNMEGSMDNNTSALSNIIVIPLVVILAIFTLAAICISVKILFHKKSEVFPGATKMLNTGKPTIMNNALPVDEQLELIPYDKRWEFPRNRLKMGIQLGVGCFGRVVKAEAIGIGGAGETVTTVAVKMVRSQTNIAALEALVSELKIMIYLGSHLNVVNLLGACTKDITKGEVLVIVEYCRFGNLQSYLTQQRNNFINQVDQFGNMIGNGTEEINGVTKRNDYYMRYDCLPTTGEESGKTECPNMNEYVDNSTNLKKPDSIWYYEQRDSEAGGNCRLTTRDLMCWSFQIARGMDYLTSKNVFHGDLAARNVLLADDGVVKVADFGMARKMYYESNYQRTGQGLIPVKWMAIESLTDRIFSSQTDVWSYGILLWELFTLGKVPYPGMDAQHLIIKELQKGYRMEKPEYAPNLIGEIMSSCWKADPGERPTFKKIEGAICDHLECSTSSYYLSLNVESSANLEESSVLNFESVMLESSQEIPAETKVLADGSGICINLKSDAKSVEQNLSLPNTGFISEMRGTNENIGATNFHSHLASSNNGSVQQDEGSYL